MQSCRVVVKPSGLWSPRQRFESAQDYKNILLVILSKYYFSNLFLCISAFVIADNSQKLSLKAKLTPYRKAWPELKQICSSSKLILQESRSLTLWDTSNPHIPSYQFEVIKNSLKAERAFTMNLYYNYLPSWNVSKPVGKTARWGIKIQSRCRKQKRTVSKESESRNLRKFYLYKLRIII